MSKKHEKILRSSVRDHSSISFIKHPFVWTRDKKDTVLNQKKVYSLAAIPSLLVAFGLIADIKGVMATEKNVLITLLIICLFIYGIINLYLITAAQRSIIRIDRQKSVALVMHRYVIHNIRDYLTYKNHKIDTKEPLTKEEIISYIRVLLESFYNQYLSINYREACTITLKFKQGDFVYSIVEGKRGINAEAPQEESIEESWVYRALRKDGKIRSYIYVKNLENLDNKEKKMLSIFKSEIRERAKGRYTTFIALPIRYGTCRIIRPSKFEPKPDLGLIGIDLLEPYGFGNLEENEIHILLCFADLISELVNDIIELK
jgi:hypothetical protein